MAPPADQKSIDLPELQRATLQQARSEAAIPMKNEPGIFARLGDADRQQAAAISANIPDWTTPGMMRPFATDSQKDAENENSPLMRILTRDARIALNVPQAFLVGSSLAGGVPGWINAARSSGAPAAASTNRAFSGIGRQPADGTQPSPTLDTLYPWPAPISQPSQPTSLFPPPTAGSGIPRLSPFAATDSTQPATTPSGAANRRRTLFPPAGGSQ